MHLSLSACDEYHPDHWTSHVTRRKDAPASFWLLLRVLFNTLQKRPFMANPNWTKVQCSTGTASCRTPPFRCNFTGFGAVRGAVSTVRCCGRAGYMLESPTKIQQNCGPIGRLSIKHELSTLWYWNIMYIPLHKTYKHHKHIFLSDCLDIQRIDILERATWPPVSNVWSSYPKRALPKHRSSGWWRCCWVPFMKWKKYLPSWWFQQIWKILVY